MISPPQATAAPSFEITPSRDLSLSFAPLGIPAELASIDEVFIPDPQERAASPLIHIQSVHAHPETQRKIHGLLKFLDKKYGIGALFVEGAAEALNPDYFRFFDEKRLNVRVAEKLLEKGELTGAELFLIESDKKIPAYGIESVSLYRDNLTAFQNVMLNRPLTGRFTKEARGALDRLETHLLSPENRKLLRASESFDAGNLQLLSYVLELERKAGEILKIDLRHYENQFDWPQLIRLLLLQEVESGLDPEKIQSERGRLVGFLREIGIEPELIQSFENLSFSPFQSGRVYDPGFRKNDLPRYLAERLVLATRQRGFSFDRYPYFTRYLEAAILQSELEAERLFDEMERLFETLVRKAAGRDEEITLTGLVQRERLFERLFDLELTPKDYAKIRLENETPRPLVRFLLGMESLQEKTRLGAAKLVPENIESVESVYGDAVRFYELAKQREQTMVDKILEVIAGRPKAGEAGIATAPMGPRDDRAHASPVTILITGGFHTEGLSHAFRKHQVPYTIVSPRITEKVSAEAYVEMLLGEKKTAFDTQYLETKAKVQLWPTKLAMSPAESRLAMALSEARLVIEAVTWAAGEEGMPVEEFATQLRNNRPNYDRLFPFTLQPYPDGDRLKPMIDYNGDGRLMPLPGSNGQLFDIGTVGQVRVNEFRVPAAVALAPRPDVGNEGAGTVVVPPGGPSGASVSSAVQRDTLQSQLNRLPKPQLGHPGSGAFNLPSLGAKTTNQKESIPQESKTWQTVLTREGLKRIPTQKSPQAAASNSPSTFFPQLLSGSVQTYAPMILGIFFIANYYFAIKQKQGAVSRARLEPHRRAEARVLQQPVKITTSWGTTLTITGNLDREIREDVFSDPQVLRYIKILQETLGHSFTEIHYVTTGGAKDFGDHTVSGKLSNQTKLHIFTDPKRFGNSSEESIENRIFSIATALASHIFLLAKPDNSKALLEAHMSNASINLGPDISTPAVPWAHMFLEIQTIRYLIQEQQDPALAHWYAKEIIQRMALTEAMLREQTRGLTSVDAFVFGLAGTFNGTSLLVLFEDQPETQNDLRERLSKLQTARKFLIHFDLFQDPARIKDPTQRDVAKDIQRFVNRHILEGEPVESVEHFENLARNIYEYSYREMFWRSVLRFIGFQLITVAVGVIVGTIIFWTYLNPGKPKNLELPNLRHSPPTITEPAESFSPPSRSEARADLWSRLKDESIVIDDRFIIDVWGMNSENNTAELAIYAPKDYRVLGGTDGIEGSRENYFHPWRPVEVAVQAQGDNVIRIEGSEGKLLIRPVRIIPSGQFGRPVLQMDIWSKPQNGRPKKSIPFDRTEAYLAKALRSLKPGLVRLTRSNNGLNYHFEQTAGSTKRQVVVRLTPEGDLLVKIEGWPDLFIPQANLTYKTIRELLDSRLSEKDLRRLKRTLGARSEARVNKAAAKRFGDEFTFQMGFFGVAAWTVSSFSTQRRSRAAEPDRVISRYEKSFKTLRGDETDVLKIRGALDRLRVGIDDGSIPPGEYSLLHVQLEYALSASSGRIDRYAAHFDRKSIVNAEKVVQSYRDMARQEIKIQDSILDLVVLTLERTGPDGNWTLFDSAVSLLINAVTEAGVGNVDAFSRLYVKLYELLPNDELWPAVKMDFKNARDGRKGRLVDTATLLNRRIKSIAGKLPGLEEKAKRTKDAMTDKNEVAKKLKDEILRINVKLQGVAPSYRPESLKGKLSDAWGRVQQAEREKRFDDAREIRDEINKLNDEIDDLELERRKFEAAFKDVNRGRIVDLPELNQPQLELDRLRTVHTQLIHILGRIRSVVELPDAALVRAEARVGVVAEFEAGYARLYGVMSSVREAIKRIESDSDFENKLEKASSSNDAQSILTLLTAPVPEEFEGVVKLETLKTLRAFVILERFVKLQDAALRVLEKSSTSQGGQIDDTAARTTLNQVAGPFYSVYDKIIEALTPLEIFGLDLWSLFPPHLREDSESAFRSESRQTDGGQARPGDTTVKEERYTSQYWLLQAIEKLNAAGFDEDELKDLYAALEVVRDIQSGRRYSRKKDPTTPQQEVESFFRHFSSTVLKKVGRDEEFVTEINMLFSAAMAVLLQPGFDQPAGYYPPVTSSSAGPLVEEEHVWINGMRRWNGDDPYAAVPSIDKFPDDPEMLRRWVEAVERALRINGREAARLSADPFPGRAGQRLGQIRRRWNRSSLATLRDNRTQLEALLRGLRERLARAEARATTGQEEQEFDWRLDVANGFVLKFNQKLGVISLKHARLTVEIDLGPEKKETAKDLVRAIFKQMEKRPIVGVKITKEGPHLIFKLKIRSGPLLRLNGTTGEFRVDNKSPDYYGAVIAETLSAAKVDLALGKLSQPVYDQLIVGLKEAKDKLVGHELPKGNGWKFFLDTGDPEVDGAILKRFEEARDPQEKAGHIDLSAEGSIWKAIDLIREIATGTGHSSFNPAVLSVLEEIALRAQRGTPSEIDARTLMEIAHPLDSMTGEDSDLRFRDIWLALEYAAKLINDKVGRLDYFQLYLAARAPLPGSREDPLGGIREILTSKGRSIEGDIEEAFSSGSFELASIQLVVKLGEEEIYRGPYSVNVVLKAIENNSEWDSTLSYKLGFKDFLGNDRKQKRVELSITALSPNEVKRARGGTRSEARQTDGGQARTGLPSGWEFKEPATKDEGKAMRQLFIDAFRRPQPNQTAFKNGWDEFSRILLDDKEKLVAAYQVWWKGVDEKGLKVARVTGFFAVAPSRSRQGNGKLFFEKIKEHFREQGFALLIGETIREDQREFWKKQGGEVLGSKKTSDKSQTFYEVQFDLRAGQPEKASKPNPQPLRSSFLQLTVLQGNQMTFVARRQATVGRIIRHLKERGVRPRFDIPHGKEATLVIGIGKKGKTRGFEDSVPIHEGESIIVLLDDLTQTLPRSEARQTDGGQARTRSEKSLVNYLSVPTNRTAFLRLIDWAKGKYLAIPEEKKPAEEVQSSEEVAQVLPALAERIGHIGFRIEDLEDDSQFNYTAAFETLGFVLNTVGKEQNRGKRTDEKDVAYLALADKALFLLNRYLAPQRAETRYAPASVGDLVGGKTLEAGGMKVTAGRIPPSMLKGRRNFPVPSFGRSASQAPPLVTLEGIIPSPFLALPPSEMLGTLARERSYFSAETLQVSEVILAISAAAMGLFNREGRANPLWSAVDFENHPALWPVLLEASRTAAEQGLTLEARIDRVLKSLHKKEPRLAALVRKKLEEPGAHSLVLDHKLSENEINSVLGPLALFPKMRLEVVVKPGVGMDEEGLRLLRERAGRFIAENRFFIEQPGPEIYEQSLTKTALGQRFYKRMGGAVPSLGADEESTWNEIAERYVVLSVPQGEEERARALDPKVKAIVYRLESAEGPEYLGAVSLLAALLIRGILDPYKQRSLERSQNRYFFDREELELYLDLVRDVAQALASAA